MSNLLDSFAGMTPGGDPTLGGSISGALSANQDLAKALQASNYETDVSQLTGGGALTVQSLDTAMKAVVQENKHFVLFNKLQQTSATNIVDEYVRQNSVGGFLGGSVNTQLGVVNGAVGDYSREVGLVKFLMTLRQVGFVLNIGKNIAEPIAVEENNGAKQLLTDAEYMLFHGNAAAVPTQFDGIFAQIDAAVNAGTVSGDHIIDMAGLPLDSVDPFSKLQAAIMQYGSWGNVTDTILTPNVQRDLNYGIDPAFRWYPDGSVLAGRDIAVGAHVSAINLQEQVLKTASDTFLAYDDFPMSKPFQITWPSQAAAATFVTASVTIDASATDTASQFTSARAGNYYYAVESIDATGVHTNIVISSQTAVAAGKHAVVTIAHSTANTETGYAIYRSKQNGTGAVPDDFRLVKIVPKASGTPTTTYTDQNRDIPGSVSVPVLNLSPSDDAIGWRQYQPMTKIMLPFGVGLAPVYSWFQFLFGYLRITKPKHHGYVKNIVPNTAKWKPFV